MQDIIKTKHGDIAVTETGSRSSETCILFIHGNSASSQYFSNQLNSETLNKYRLVCLDLPGHGQSSNATNPNSDYTISGYADMVIEVIEQMELFDCVLVGWSLGGHIALEAIAKKARVKGLVLTGTPPVGPGLDDMPKAFLPTETMAFAGQELFTEAQAKQFALAIVGEKQNISQHLLDDVKRADGISRKIMLENFADENSAHSQIATIEQWDKPIAVLQGENDIFINSGYLSSLNWNNLWQKQIHFLVNSGHAPFIDSADEYNKVLDSFISKI
ncbi:MAG: alpha/beta hydrolase [Gammaproteobacteria bacterium]|nr:MAG: alpha/beta hydrolase [Gammaproteobacteria bacterium]